MVKRRSLDDALSPEEAAFLESGKARASRAKQSQDRAKPKPKPVPEPASTATQPAYYPTHDIGLVALNVRIEPSISTALLRASMERKIQRKEPFSQREIVAEALRSWLQREGFME